jgi:hypothetical protein
MSRPLRRENLSQANKLSRTYTTLLEALNRHRGKGQQKVTVEHVNVHFPADKPSSVLSVRGEGWLAKIKGNPTQKLFPMHLSPRCGARTKERKPLPIRGDVERAMPNARRSLAGRTERQGER